ncbi:MAG: TIGR03790 family protein [Phycisphaerales bacterium]|nr:TIGR03790 family protein [Phycisphaerales bacterium]
MEGKGRLQTATYALLAMIALVPSAWAGTDRTADMPDSWLVLYNTNNPESVTWANWYQEQWNIPPDRLFGIDAPSEEGLANLQVVQSRIITPVRDLLNIVPELEQTTMGILLGYGMPGHYGNPPQDPSTGGFSIANALQDIHDDSLAAALQRDDNLDNPHFLGRILPTERLTKATMTSGRYMAARIDAPTLAEAMALTIRAKALSDPSNSLFGESVYFDYFDADFPDPSNEWFWLKSATQSAELATLPWVQFDVDSNIQLPSDAFRFAIYKLLGWSATDFECPDPGSRVLAYHLNSLGALTVRSTTGEGGAYVPNALAAGYAAAIGATGEPGCCIGPFPDTLLAGLREGWTLGESFYLANPFDDWMWTLVGDPFLTLPNWFDPPPIGPGDGDMNNDGTVDGLDIPMFVQAFTGELTEIEVTSTADMDGDADLDDDDLFLFMAPILFESYDFDLLRGSGDANGDGHVDGRDISAFVDKLINGFDGDESLRERFGPDTNKDGEITVDDVPTFVDRLL